MSKSELLNFRDDNISTRNIPLICETIENVVLISSSSRGGSSLFSEYLRNSDELYHLKAEISPFLVLSGLSYNPPKINSDEVNGSMLNDATIKRLQKELDFEIGNKLDKLSLDSLWDFSVDIVLRLSLQYEVCIDPNIIHKFIADFFNQRPELIVSSFDNYLKEFQKEIDSFLSGLIPEYTSENYDNSSVLSKLSQTHKYIEEPPFVRSIPWSSPTMESYDRTRPLIIKTPSNAYRYDLFKHLFPNAKVKVIHLTREAGPSINGLIDGWKSDQVHSHCVGDLSIDGYGDSSWWKFDLPPGWSRFRNSTLVDICCFQWSSAHRAILDYLKSSGADYHRIKFESLLNSSHDRVNVFSDLFSWLNQTFDDKCRKAVVSGLAPVMSTNVPATDRWLKREHEITEAIKRAELEPLIKELGHEQ